MPESLLIGLHNTKDGHLPRDKNACGFRYSIALSLRGVKRIPLDWGAGGWKGQVEADGGIPVGA